MGYLSRDAILSAEDREYGEVAVPEWGGTVRIRSLTGLEYDQFQKDIMTGRGQKRDVRFENLRTRLIIKCAVDGNGEPLFSPADLVVLNGKNSKPIDRLFEACQEITGMSDDDVEEMTKDFEKTQSSEPSSD